jgi:hypothetical protein
MIPLFYPRKLWVEDSHRRVCEQMDEEMFPDTDCPERTMEVILARIQYAEKWADEAAALHWLRSFGMELV